MSVATGGGLDLDQLVIGPCMATFGEAVIYQPANGTPFPITAIFDRPFREVEPTGDGGAYGVGRPSHISTSEPRLGVQLSQFAVPPAQGDLLIARGLQFWVREVRPDGQGAAHLSLNLQQGQM